MPTARYMNDASIEQQTASAYTAQECAWCGLELPGSLIIFLHRENWTSLYACVSCGEKQVTAMRTRGYDAQREV